MNRLEILEVEAGKKLDACIAEWKDGCYHDWKGQPIIHGGLFLVCTKCDASRNGGRYLPNQYYSTDISAAWQVVEKMIKDELSLELIIGADGNTLATFFNIGEIVYRHNPNQVVCESVPEAICKAALLAIAQA